MKFYDNCLYIHVRRKLAALWLVSDQPCGAHRSSCMSGGLRAPHYKKRWEIFLFGSPLPKVKP
ncbi:hypothetical protein WA1_30780 [Scytonema hofmannii PCC 7110]|uniref:Uncharacterized protein n=1 Tax=Scytonema hofmannii PCC 7110 TaxID=128403 RepID=A0A139X4T4_9CYAN|nr:hypothetical protein WA1_30780 [Scytonema hofmannii PCC 7110]